MKYIILAFVLFFTASWLNDPGKPPVATVAVVQPTPELPKPVVKHTSEQCIASAIYYEARGEPIEGQRAVYDVIMHRVKATKKSPCAVVKARAQFSWYPEKPIRKYDNGLKKLLTYVKNHPKILTNENYKWFFGKHIKPRWSINMECFDIGGHRFCKEKEKEIYATAEI